MVIWEIEKAYWDWSDKLNGAFEMANFGLDIMIDFLKI